MTASRSFSTLANYPIAPAVEAPFYSRTRRKAFFCSMPSSAAKSSMVTLRKAMGKKSAAATADNALRRQTPLGRAGALWVKWFQVCAFIYVGN